MATGNYEIAFVFPPGGRSRTFEYHLGVAYIQAYLKQYGYNSTQVVPTHPTNLNETVDAVLSTGAPIVGFTCFDTNSFLVRLLSERIKRKSPATVIIAGGPTATFSDDMLMGHIPSIDAAIRFEGEQTVKELIDHMQECGSLKNLDHIRGLSFRLKNRILRTQDRELFSCRQNTLDELPSPYILGILNGSEGCGVLTSRGCVHHCTYCNFAAMSQKTVRFHSVDRVIQELKTIQSRRPLHTKESSNYQEIIPVNDDAFSLNAKRAKIICNRIIKEKINLNLSCLCRADNLDEELVVLFKHAGFIDLSFGLESAVPEILRNIKKVSAQIPARKHEQYVAEKRFLAKVKEDVRLAKKHGLRTTVSVIIGLSGESYEQAMQTIDFVKDLEVDSYSHNALVVSRGTELYRTAKDYGIDISFSKRYLRYVTHHAYTVQDVPYLDNSSLALDYQRIATNIQKSFCNYGLENEKDNRWAQSATVTIEDTASLTNILEWVGESLSVCGSLFILLSEKFEKAHLEKLFDCIAYMIPSEQCYLFKERQEFPGMPAYVMLKEAGLRQHQHYVKVPFSSYGTYLDHTRDAGNSENYRPLVQLNETQDIRNLAGYCQMWSNSTASRYPLLRGVVEDGCRWGRALCPALDLNSICVDSTGTVKPCRTGKIIGTYKNNLDELRARLKFQYEQIQKERGCRSCHIRHTCSKCLFTAPVNPEDYCRIRHDFQNMEEFIVINNVINIEYHRSKYY